MVSVPVSLILDRKGHEVATISGGVPVADAVASLVDEGIGALVVLDDGGEVTGILSERDVVRAVAEGPGALERSVAEVMTRPVTTCTPETRTTELATTMTEGRIRHLPVLEEGRLVGIVSIGDVVKSRIDELSTQAESLERYVTGTA